MFNETKDGNITLITHAPTQELQSIISKAGFIISRSGYTTIMDFQAIGKKHVIFIPTPGQTEQEYLASQLEKRGISYTQTQDRFNLVQALERSKQYNGFEASKHPTNLLNEAVQDLLHQI
jgi:UDP-N-acetylglucosamine:LPS N-acetylglucosamine transferase